MNLLMFNVGTTIPGQTARQVCVFFRQSQPTDTEVLEIKYGNGCSASVSRQKQYLRKSLLLSIRSVMAQIMKNQLIYNWDHVFKMVSSNMN